MPEKVVPPPLDYHFEGQLRVGGGAYILEKGVCNARASTAGVSQRIMCTCSIVRSSSMCTNICFVALQLPLS